MPELFLPEIENFAEENPLLYEVLFRIQQTINAIPISSGAATPAPSPALDPVTGLPLTDSSGNPLFTIPQTTNPGGTLPSANIPSNESGIYVSTDPTGLASGAYIFGGVWQLITKIIRPSDAALVGSPGKKFLVPGMAVAQGLQFDNQGRPTSSFFTNPVDNCGIPVTSNVSQHGTTTQIDVASTTWQFGGFQVVYNSGSVDPGSYGTFNVFFDDPQFNGGVVVYQAVAPGTATPLKKRGRFSLGQITTAGGGGGSGSGSGNGGAGRFYN